jgi:hypothetical protein
VLTAATKGVDAIYRVTADVSERMRPATAAELEGTWRAPRALFGALGLVAADKVREESVTGTAVLISFTRTGTPAKALITGRAVRVEPTVGSARLDVDAAVLAALRALPPPPAPEWEAVARRLASAGCPTYALALADARLLDGPARRAVRATALGALRRPTARRSTSQPPPPAAPEPEPAPAAEARASEDEPWSCRSLCNMHMVEICNQDKALWQAHGRRWEATACGAMRDDDFLRTCYRQQWLSGTYHDECLAPCEGGSGGRDRLLHLLQSAGCLRTRAS